MEAKTHKLQKFEDFLLRKQAKMCEIDNFDGLKVVLEEEEPVEVMQKGYIKNNYL